MKLPLLFKLSLLTGFLLPTLTYIFLYAPIHQDPGQTSISKITIDPVQPTPIYFRHSISTEIAENEENQTQASQVDPLVPMSTVQPASQNAKGTSRESARSEGQVLSAESQLDPNSSSTHTVNFFEKQLFFSGLQGASQTALPQVPFAHIQGGITPHHLLASTILSRFFAEIASSPQQPSTILIIGPNHKEAGHYPVLTSQFDWSTAFGVSAHDQVLTDHLINQQIAQADETVVPADHSVTDTIPYIKYYLPNTKVVPLLVSNTMSIGEIDRLADQLSTTLPADTMIVAAVDFSHYLNAKEADEKDQTTRTLMQTQDYEKILALNNDYLDAPVSIVLFLKLMEKNEANHEMLLDHTNSGYLKNDPYIETTSYFSMLFGRD